MEVGEEGDYVPTATLSPPLENDSWMKMGRMRAILMFQ